MKPSRIRKLLRHWYQTAYITRKLWRREKGKYTIHYPYDYCTYSPWFEPWFNDIYETIKDYTLVSEDRCYIINQFCDYCIKLPGNFGECGVFKGGTALLIAMAMDQAGIAGADKNLHLFDTFKGMPYFAKKSRDQHNPGDFGDTSLDDVKKLLYRFSMIKFYPGIIPDTFKDVANKQFSFVHIDVDIFPTMLECSKFFYNHLVRGGILLFDDYGFPSYKNAAKAAIDEFFKDKPENPITLQTGQCFIIKL